MNINIKGITKNDIPAIVEIWHEASLKAHGFIPEDYWSTNKELMKNLYIPESETYQAVQGEQILGFISLIDNYLAALFIKPEFQENGVGSSLLHYAKTLRDSLNLKVFSKNSKSVDFYKRKGFSVTAESIDNDTGENELIMEWHK